MSRFKCALAILIIFVFALSIKSSVILFSMFQDTKVENIKDHDHVQGNFTDTYDHLSYKNIMGKLWVSVFCEQAEFVVKTHDDMFVDLYEVFVCIKTIVLYSALFSGLFLF